jgi:hypothetical protein
VSAHATGSEGKAIPGRIIVKFRADSYAASYWASTGRNGELPFLKKTIGAHTTRPFIGDNILKAVAKRLKGNTLRRTNIYSLTDELSRICVIDAASPSDIRAIIGKLENEPQIEYAEVSYKRNISDIPNDPLISQQRFLDQIKAFDGWDALPSPLPSRPLVAIVDTGVDYLHEDLKDNIFTNPGEDGTDSQGRNKQTNNVDDDGNGFIDDWHGWDFTVTGSGSDQDNNPLPGHPHGTHVAGIAGAVTDNGIGIASAGRYIQILPVKVGPDDPNSLSVYNSYEGIMYAAAMGATIINCSWGGPGSSRSEEEITTAALQMGSLIVAAAGNDGIEGGFYPAAYPGVLSVASVNYLDVKSGFSNYHRTVDISAPGENIFSTLLNNQYGEMSGTSMASPVVAGVAALVSLSFPDYSPLQIGEQLKATADTNDSKQFTQYRGLLGTGRVNVLRALTDTETRSAIISQFSIQDENRDSIFEAGEQLEIFFTVINALAPLDEASLKVSSISPLTPLFIRDSAALGDMPTGAVRNAENSIIFRIPGNVPYNHVFEIEVQIRDVRGTVSRQIIAVTVRPSYRTFSANNLAVTFNSEGNIGFNDYPENNQGIGFRYKGGENLLYEGAFMAGTSSEKLSNVARNNNQVEKDESFHLVEAIGITKPGILAVQEGQTVFADNNMSDEVGISVRQKIYQFNDPDREDFIISVYDVVNRSGAPLKNFYAGLFFDWDLGPSGANNQARFSNDEGFGYVVNVHDQTYPWAGVQVLSHQPNFYALDNDGSGGSINIYNGFSRTEKWAALQGRRFQSTVGDVSFVIGAGPLNIGVGDTSRIAVSLLASPTFSGLRTAAQNALKTAGEIGIDTVTYMPIPDETKIVGIFPSLASTNATIEVNFVLSKQSNIELRVVDILGRTVLIVEQLEDALGEKSAFFETKGMAQGQYFVQMISNLGSYALPFIIKD